MFHHRVPIYETTGDRNLTFWEELLRHSSETIDWFNNLTNKL